MNIRNTIHLAVAIAFGGLSTLALAQDNSVPADILVCGEPAEDAESIEAPEDTTIVRNNCNSDVYVAFRSGHQWRWHTQAQLSSENRVTESTETSPDFHWPFIYFFRSDFGLPYDFRRYQNSDDKNWSVAGIPPKSHVLLPGMESTGLVLKGCPPDVVPFQWDNC